MTPLSLPNFKESTSQMRRKPLWKTVIGHNNQTLWSFAESRTCWGEATTGATTQMGTGRVRGPYSLPIIIPFYLFYSLFFTAPESSSRKD